MDGGRLEGVLKTLAWEFQSSGIKTIYCYSGDDRHDPVFYEEVPLLKAMLEETHIDCPVLEISDREFEPAMWDRETSLAFMPGAPSSLLHDHLVNKIDDLKKFVNDGGAIILQCGAAYWACREVEYRLSATQKINKIRELALWKGKSVGPLLFCDKNQSNDIEYYHDTVEIHWLGSDSLKRNYPDGLKVQTFLSGGGTLFPAAEEYPSKILATYSDQTRTIVKTTVGKGTAILANPYFIHSADYFKSGLQGFEENFPQHNWQKIIENLEPASEKLKSQVCFVDMLLEASRGSTNK
jgi:glutamine amidotransferase-like uncharacterized protein